jgi:hypothetical protein
VRENPLPNRSSPYTVEVQVESPDWHRTCFSAPRNLEALKVLRITVVDSSDSVVRLRVEGRLTGPSVEELRETCDLHIAGEGVRLVLDLADISFADGRGIEILKDLKRRNVALLKLAPFLASQLRDP